MYAFELKKNTYFYVIIKNNGQNMYELIEICYSYETAYKYVRLNGNSKYLIMKMKLKEVIHQWEKKKR